MNVDVDGKMGRMNGVREGTESASDEAADLISAGVGSIQDVTPT